MRDADAFFGDLQPKTKKAKQKTIDEHAIPICRCLTFGFIGFMQALQYITCPGQGAW